MYCDLSVSNTSKLSKAVHKTGQRSGLDWLFVLALMCMVPAANKPVALSMDSGLENISALAVNNPYIVLEVASKQASKQANYNGMQVTAGVAKVSGRTAQPVLATLR